MDPLQLGWEPLVESWMATELPDNIKPEVGKLIRKVCFEKKMNDEKMLDILSATIYNYPHHLSTHETQGQNFRTAVPL